MSRTEAQSFESVGGPETLDTFTILLAILAKVVAEVAGWVCVHSTSLLSVLASLCDGTLDGERIKSKY